MDEEIGPGAPSAEQAATVDQRPTCGDSRRVEQLATEQEVEEEVEARGLHSSPLCRRKRGIHSSAGIQAGWRR